jgi:hypothetical protein
MLIEELFSRGIMTMGPSRRDPGRHVGVFHSDFVASLPALRAAEMERFHWLAGDWNYENDVPATRVSPAYTDVGNSKFALCEKGRWICLVDPDGQKSRHITFDPFSRQWIYVLMQGAYGILRSPQGWIGERIVFSGLMTMIGINCEWRMTWAKTGCDEFGFLNEERSENDSWAYIDEWRFKRKR